MTVLIIVHHFFLTRAAFCFGPLFRSPGYTYDTVQCDGINAGTDSGVSAACEPIESPFPEPEAIPNVTCEWSLVRP